MSQRIDEMAPDSRRAKELFDRNTHLAKNLKETTAALAALDEEHNVLQELHRNLTVSKVFVYFTVYLQFFFDARIYTFVIGFAGCSYQHNAQATANIGRE